MPWIDLLILLGNFLNSWIFLIAGFGVLSIIFAMVVPEIIEIVKKWKN